MAGVRNAMKLRINHSSAPRITPLDGVPPLPKRKADPKRRATTAKAAKQRSGSPLARTEPRLPRRGR